MKRILVLGLVLFGCSSMFAGMLGEVPEQTYTLLIDGKEQQTVSSCTEALGKAEILLNNNHQKVRIDGKYPATALPGCRGDIYTSAAQAEKASIELSKWIEKHMK